MDDQGREDGGAGQEQQQYACGGLLCVGVEASKRHRFGLAGKLSAPRIFIRAHCHSVSLWRLGLVRKQQAHFRCGRYDLTGLTV